MRVVESGLGGVLVFEPKASVDQRGFFCGRYREDLFRAASGCARPSVRDSHSRSLRHVLRGMHYQARQPQGRLVRVALSAGNKRQTGVPEGFAHGFLVLFDVAETADKATGYDAPRLERSLRWDDAGVGIGWPVTVPPILSAKDAAGSPLTACEAIETHD